MPKAEKGIIVSCMCCHFDKKAECKEEATQFEEEHTQETGHRNCYRWI